MLATSGDTNLGGEDFDQQIMAHFVKQITKERHIDISKDARALQKLRKEAERARRELSSKSSAMLEVDAILKGDDFQDAITRAKFEQLCADPFKEAAAWRGNNMWRLRAIGGGSGKGRTTFPHTARKNRVEVKVHPWPPRVLRGLDVGGGAGIDSNFNFNFNAHLGN